MPFVIWLTGIPASGKSTIARRLLGLLRKHNAKVELLESDELRKVLTPRPSYTEAERDWFYGVLVWLGHLLYRNGINVVIDATAHKKHYRDSARDLFGKDFIEVYVMCPLRIAMARDPKGLYRRALRGEITTLPGLQVPYEEPDNPEIIIDTAKEEPDEAANRIVRYLREKGYLPDVRSVATRRL